MGCKGSEVQILSPRQSSKKTVLPGAVFIFNIVLFEAIIKNLYNYPMQSNEPIYSSPTPNPPPTNRHSIVSLVLGLITLFLFCGGILIPIPFTSFICVPISALIGLGAFIYGIISLNTIRKNNETGHPMAWSGILIGGFVFLCLLCMIVAILSLFNFAPQYVPPFLQGYQI